MLSKTVLISIHPKHVAKILSGEKRLEFRRTWANKPVDRLLIYSTTPKKQLVAFVKIKRTISGTPTALWALAQQVGGGVTRQQLYDYLNGKQTAIALEISGVNSLGVGIDPTVIFGRGFRAPQSFRYLRQNEEVKLNKFIAK